MLKKEKAGKMVPSTIPPALERGDLPAAAGLSGRNAGFKEVKSPAKEAFNKNYIKLYLEGPHHGGGTATTNNKGHEVPRYCGL
jgi:hypothetical protein